MAGGTGRTGMLEPLSTKLGMHVHLQWQLESQSITVVATTANGALMMLNMATMQSSQWERVPDVYSAVHSIGQCRLPLQVTNLGFSLAFEGSKHATRLNLSALKHAASESTLCWSESVGTGAGHTKSARHG